MNTRTRKAIGCAAAIALAPAAANATTFECPPDAIDEDEPSCFGFPGDNNGCDVAASTPPTRPLNIGDVYCGTVFISGDATYIDSDAYLITLDRERDVTITLNTDVVVDLSIVRFDDPFNPDCSAITITDAITNGGGTGLTQLTINTTLPEGSTIVRVGAPVPGPIGLCNSRYSIDIQPGPCPGDRAVGPDDLFTVLANFGQSVTGGAAQGDVSPPDNPNGNVGPTDLFFVLSRFGNTCP